MRQTRTYRMFKAQAMVTGTPKGGLHRCLLERALQVQPQPCSIQSPLPMWQLPGLKEVMLHQAQRASRPHEAQS